MFALDFAIAAVKVWRFHPAFYISLEAFTCHFLIIRYRASAQRTNRLIKAFLLLARSLTYFKSQMKSSQAFSYFSTVWRVNTTRLLGSVIHVGVCFPRLRVLRSLRTNR